MKQQDKKLSENIQRLQAVVNDLLATDLREYAIQHKLSLLDSHFSRLDQLLDAGIIYIKQV